MTIETAIQNLLNSYIDCLDADRLEEWPEHFPEDGKYSIITRENLDAGLDGGHWMYYTSRAMMRDRITSLRHITTYNKYYTRHFTSNLKVEAQEAESYTARSNFLLVQVNFEGKTEGIRSGEYIDSIIEHNGALKFREKQVIVDTFHSETTLVNPL